MSDIVERLAAVAKALGPINKDQIEIPGQRGYKAFTIDNVYAHLGPLFAANQIVVVPRVTSADYDTYSTRSGSIGTVVRLMVDYDFVGPTGDAVTMTVAAEGRDTSDKGTNKAMQQAIKYGLIQMFQIATGEVDPDATSVDSGEDHTARASAAIVALYPDDLDTARSLWLSIMDLVGHVSNAPMPSVLADAVIAIAQNSQGNDVPTSNVDDDVARDGTEPETEGGDTVPDEPDKGGA